jgi:uncharacterized repeat protein (TIGR02543 family)
MHNRCPAIPEFLIKFASWLFLAIILTLQNVHAQSVLNVPNLVLQSQGSINAITKQPDGKMLIGGNFNYVNGVARNNLARLNVDGSLDLSWDPNIDNSVQTFHYVQAIVVDSSGKVYIGGNFSTVGTETRYGLARIDGTTGVVDSWHPSTGGTINALALDEVSGRLYAGGNFAFSNTQNNSTISNLVKISTATGLADAWDAQSDNAINSLALDGAGNLFAAGFFTSIGGQPRNYIAKLDASTALATSWDAGADNYVNSLALNGSGNLYVGGSFTRIGNQARNGLAKLDANSALAVTNWDAQASGSYGSTVTAILPDSSGNLYVSGLFTNIGGQARTNLARLDASAKAASWIADTDNIPLTLTLDGQGQLYAGGQFLNIGGQFRPAIARLDPASATVASLPSSVGSTAMVSAIARQESGKIVVGGTFAFADLTPRNNLLRLNTDGTLDAAWHPDPDGPVFGLAADTLGHVYVGGIFNQIGGKSHMSAAQIDEITGLASDWDTGLDTANGDTVNTIAVENNEVYLGGNFNLYSNSIHPNLNSLAKFNNTTGEATSWDAKLSGLNSVKAIAVDGAGHVYVGGLFSGADQSTRNNIVKLESATGVATPWDANVNGVVNALAIDKAGNVVMGGDFSSSGGVARNNLAKLDSISGIATAWNPNADGAVISLAVESSGTIYAGGYFTHITGLQRNHLAQIYSNGSGLATAWNPNVDNIVAGLVLEGSGNVFVGGNFSSIGGQARYGLASLSPGFPEVTYGITYNANGSTSGVAPSDPGVYSPGTTVTVLANTGNLVKNGYTFAGWNTTPDGSGTIYAGGTSFAIGANIILYAQWNATTYGVTYNGNTSTSGANPVDIATYPAGATVTVLGNTGNLIKSGYIFDGWNTAADGSGTRYASGVSFSIGAGNVSLYAQWVAATYSVTYFGNNSSGGTVPVDSSAYLAGATVIVPGNTGSLLRSGYLFAGWNTAADGSGIAYTGGTSFAMASGNVVLYAQWSVLVTYDGNGNTAGAVPVDAAAYTQRSMATVLGNSGNLLKAGYHFVGWNTGASGLGTPYRVGDSFGIGTSAVTLYAQWALNSVLTSQFFGNDATNASTISSILSGATYDMGAAVWYDINTTSIERNTFAYKLMSGFFMLGYQTEMNAQVYTDQNTRALHLFQNNNGLAVTNLVDSATLLKMDTLLAQREAVLAPIAQTFVLNNHIKPLHPNDVSQDTVASIYALSMNVLPASLQMDAFESVQCISGQCVGAIQDPNGNPLYGYFGTGNFIDLNTSNYRFVGAYFDPAVGNARLPSAVVDVDTVLHEYAHYLDGTYGMTWGSYPGNPQTPHWNSLNTTGFYAIHYDLSIGNSSGCLTPLSNNVSDWMSLYGYVGSYNCPQAGQRVPVEDFAEAFAFYVMSGLDYRTAATQSTMIARQYAWLKNNVFQGVEYDTALPEGINSGCNDVPGTASRQPGHVRCDDNFVWDFTIPHGVTNGSCGSSHGATLSAAPAKNLCSHGAPTQVSGSGPWAWSCNGLNGGTGTMCSADAALIPDPPTNVTATAGDGQATISFSAPAYLGGNAILDYTVTSSRGETQTGVASPITIHGLTNGLHYTFTVTARNASGSSALSFSSNDVLPLGPPGAPTNVVATAGNLQASVSFSPPASDGGSTIGSYTVTSNPGKLTGSGSASPILVSGLTTGLTYTFTVSATNVNGTGPDSAPSNQMTMSMLMLPTVNLDSVTPPALPSNWQSVVQIGSSGAWYSNAGTHVPSGITSHSGNNLVYFNSSSAGVNQSARLISPSFSLAGITGAKVSFWMYRDPTISVQTIADYLDVYLNTNNTLTGATNLTTSSISRSKAYSPVVSTGGWYYYQYDIPVNFNGSSNYVIFLGHSAGGGNDIHLDDITIATVPVAPSIVSAQPGNGSASIAFTAGDDGGSPISTFTASCTPVAGGATLTGTGSSSPILVSGLGNGINYTCSVTSTSTIGTSVASGTVAVTPLSNNADLSILGVSSGSLSPGFASATLAYADGVPFSVASINVTPTSADSNASITVNNVAVISGNTSSPITLSVGSNTITVNVTAQDGTTHKIYTLNVARAAAYIMTYDGNTNTGGTVPADAGSYAQGATVTVLGNSGVLVKNGYSFAGWNTAANGSGTSQSVASTFVMGAANVTLYAQWLVSLNIIPGWNLLGNSIDVSLDVASVLGDKTQVETVWKWIPKANRWAFFTPALSTADLKSYTQDKGYEVLTTVYGGEGFWVNSKADFAISLPMGSPVSSNTFADQSTVSNKLPAGWSLIAVGDNPSPVNFVNTIALATAQPVYPDVAAISLMTLWAWDSASKNWYFYAPTLHNSGGLASYISQKGYLDFTLQGKTLDTTTGFWVNHR